MGISRNNLIVMVFTFLFYMIFDAYFFMYPSPNFIFVLFVQLLFILVAISPIGAFFLRLIYGSRPLATQREKEYLLPIFEVVYSDALTYNTKLNQSIQLFIDDSMAVNAYAIGSNAITVTRGAVQLLSEEELKGVLAHEFGHLSNGDTILPLFLLVGNSIFLFVLFIIKFFELMIGFANWFIRSNPVLCMIGLLIQNLTHLSMNLLLFIVQALLFINQRHNEYRADLFAHHIGYGTELIEVLYKLQGMEMGHKAKILERIKSSHPNIAFRIGKLEQLQENELILA